MNGVLGLIQLVLSLGQRRENIQKGAIDFGADLRVAKHRGRDPFQMSFVLHPRCTYQEYAALCSVHAPQIRRRIHWRAVDEDRVYRFEAEYQKTSC